MVGLDRLIGGFEMVDRLIGGFLCRWVIVRRDGGFGSAWVG